MGVVGIRPKQIVEQHDYHGKKQSKVQGAYDHNRYICSYSLIEQQIRADAMLLRQLYEDEKRQFEEPLKQVENKRSNEYHLNQMRHQIILNQSKFVIKIE